MKAGYNIIDVAVGGENQAWSELLIVRARWRRCMTATAILTPN